MNDQSIIIDHRFDDQMLNQIRMLREIRIGLLKSQLMNLQATYQELTSRQLIDSSKSAMRLEDLRIELEQQLAKLADRYCDDDQVYFDELELYIDVLSRESQS